MESVKPKVKALPKETAASIKENLLDQRPMTKQVKEDIMVCFVVRKTFNDDKKRTHCATEVDLFWDKHEASLKLKKIRENTILEGILERSWNGEEILEVLPWEELRGKIRRVYATIWNPAWETINKKEEEWSNFVAEIGRKDLLELSEEKLVSMYEMLNKGVIHFNTKEEFYLESWTKVRVHGMCYKKKQL